MKNVVGGFAILLLMGSSATAQIAARNPVPTKATEIAAAGSSKIDPAKEGDIRRLLELTGARALVEQTMTDMTKTLRPTLINALPVGDYREKLADLFFAKLVAKADPQGILDLAIPSYDKNFSHDEIRGLIQFYQTPLGKKSISVMPQLLAELQASGRKWGETIGRQCMIEVISEHPEFEKQIAEAQRTAQAQK